MISSTNCFLRDCCNKYKNNQECASVEMVCPYLFKVEFLYKEALLTENQFNKKTLWIKSEFNGIDKPEYKKLADIEKDIKQFVDNGKNLYIHSNTVGCGKTSWSIRLLQAYLKRIWADSSLRCRGLFINVPRFLLAIKDNISERNDYAMHIKKNIYSADLVIWDEIATKSLTTYEHEHLLSLINTRLDTGKSNIYTSNLDPTELTEKLGERLCSRIKGMSEEIIFNGKDMRGVKFK